MQNLKGATANGFHIGVYFYTNAITEKEAIAEAEFTLNKIKGYKIDMPVVIDIEWSSSTDRIAKITPALRTKCVLAFMKTIAKAGYQPMFYCGYYFLKDNLVASQLKDYPMWLAQYYKTPVCNRPFSVWQYTSSGRVDGINGNVDMNIGYVEFWKNKVEKPTNTATNNTNTSAKDKLLVDGWIGVLSVNKWQKWMKTPQDGFISGQATISKRWFPRLTSVKYGAGGSTCVKATQRHLIGKGFNCGENGVDGRLGHDTIQALQMFLNKFEKAGLRTNGVLDDKTAKAFQKFLNEVK